MNLIRTRRFPRRSSGNPWRDIPVAGEQIEARVHPNPRCPQMKEPRATARILPGGVIPRALFWLRNARRLVSQ